MTEGLWFTDGILLLTVQAGQSYRCTGLISEANSRLASRSMATSGGIFMGYFLFYNIDEGGPHERDGCREGG